MSLYLQELAYPAIQAALRDAKVLQQNSAFLKLAERCNNGTNHFSPKITLQY